MKVLHHLQPQISYAGGNTIPRKLTYDYVKSVIEKEGYKLLSRSYKDNKQKLVLTCPNGHKIAINYNKFSLGRRCAICNNKLARERKLLVYEEVKEYIESKGYQLISTEYTGAHDKLLIQCKNDHEFYQSLHSFKRGNRCPICPPISIEIIIQELGYKLISKHKNKYTICCSKNHIFTLTTSELRRGYKCPECSRRLKSYDHIVKYINSFGFEVLNKSEIHKNDKITLKCKHNHIFELNFASFRRSDKKCPICKKEIRQKQDFLRAKKYIESYGYKLLSDEIEHKNSNTKLLLECTFGHRYKTSFTNFKSGHRCRICTIHTWKGGVSKLNIPLYDTYAHQLEPVEETRKDPDNQDYLQVRCSNCQKWFRPKRSDVMNRRNAINSNGGYRFYCSDKCKQACPVYRQNKYPKGFKDYKRPHQKEWANLVKSRDNYTCQICGSTDNLVAHHIDPIVCDPVQSLDIDNGVTLCDKCHKKVHTQNGCKLSELREKL